MAAGILNHFRQKASLFSGKDLIGHRGIFNQINDLIPTARKRPSQDLGKDGGPDHLVARESKQLGCQRLPPLNKHQGAADVFGMTAAL
jgi:hypothetical protein